MPTVYVLADDSVKFGMPVLAQHGVSFYVDLGDEAFLMDTGWYGDIVVNNAKKMKVDLKKVNGIFLTHCHYDHTGGIIEVLKAIGKDEVPIFAHPAIFRRSFIKKGKRYRYVGIPVKREEIEEGGGKLVLLDRPTKLVEGLWSTGEVPRITDFEDTGVKAFFKEGGVMKEDLMMDDMSLILKLDDGIVVMSGCGHAGIVNIVRRAREIMKSDVLAVMGGFHLINASRERVEKTIREFKALGVEKVIAGHCTGFEAQKAFSKAYGKKFIPMGTGLKVSF